MIGHRRLPYHQRPSIVNLLLGAYSFRLTTASVPIVPSKIMLTFNYAATFSLPVHPNPHQPAILVQLYRIREYFKSLRLY